MRTLNTNAPTIIPRPAAGASAPHSALGTINSPLSTSRLTYTDGYVRPGTVPTAGQTTLPDDIERAAV